MKNFIVVLASLAIVISAFAGGPDFNYGNTANITTNIAARGGVFTNNSDKFPQMTSGFTTNAVNLPPADSLARLRLRAVNTNNTAIVVYGSSSTNTPIALYLIPGSNGVLNIEYPLIDTKQEYYFGPLTNAVSNTPPIVVESFGKIQ